VLTDTLMLIQHYYAVYGIICHPSQETENDVGVDFQTSVGMVYGNCIFTVDSSQIALSRNFEHSNVFLVFTLAVVCAPGKCCEP